MIRSRFCSKQLAPLPEGMTMNVKRSIGGFLAAAILTTTITLIPAPASATGDLSGFCAYVAETIATLEAKPESRLQQFLLAQARRIFALYCS
jgi:hypothetical protein